MVLESVRRWRDQVLAWDDIPIPCPIDWAPSVFTPVFYGYRDHELTLPPPEPELAPIASAAPGDLAIPLPGSMEARCRVFYPSLDGSPPDAPVLTGCATTPLIVFSHGQCAPGGQIPGNFHHAWYELPATLARAGYVVVVPDYDDPNSDEDLERLVRLIRWVRSSTSPYASMLKSPPQTGLVGHSYGAAMTVRAMKERRIPVGGYALLSPQGSSSVDIPQPVLWTWGDGGDLTADPRIDFWEPTQPAHAVQFVGAEHHDYMPFGRVECAKSQQNDVRLMPHLAADIVTLFFGRYLPQDRPRRRDRWLPWPVRPRVSARLEPVNWPLTTEQKFFAGGWFSAWPLLETGNYQQVIMHYRARGEWRTIVRGD